MRGSVRLTALCVLLRDRSLCVCAHLLAWVWHWKSGHQSGPVIHTQRLLFIQLRIIIRTGHTATVLQMPPRNDWQRGRLEGWHLYSSNVRRPNLRVVKRHLGGLVLGKSLSFRHSQSGDSWGRRRGSRANFQVRCMCLCLERRGDMEQVETNMQQNKLTHRTSRSLDSEKA